MFRRLAAVALATAVAIGVVHAYAPHARVRVTIAERTRSHMLENLAYASALPAGPDRDAATAFATSYVRRFDTRGTHGIAGSLA